MGIFEKIKVYYLSFMYKKKTPQKVSSHYGIVIAIIITALVFCLSEYFFFFPSGVIHNPQILTSLYNGKNTNTCTSEYAPVCGKNNITYDNSCFAKAAHISVARVGKCTTAIDEDNNGSSWTPITIQESTISQVSTWILTQEFTLDTTKLQNYTNNSFKYSLALPKYAYYQWLVSPDKKSHILTIDLSASGVLRTETALMWLTYYKSGDTVSSGKKTIPLESWTLVVNYAEPLSLKWREILDTITMSAKSLP